MPQIKERKVKIQAIEKEMPRLVKENNKLKEKATRVALQEMLEP